jgi:hypothetical protein
MSQAPTPYERQKNFVSDATNNPSITVPQIATGLDAEFVAVQDSLNDTINRLGEIQRDDGALRDAIVSTQSLSPTVLALIGLNGVVARGAWVAATAYAAGDVVGNGGGTYLCAAAHTANVDFTVDQANGRWLTLEAPFNNSVSVQRFTGNGTQAAYALGVTGTVNVTNVFINGVYQNKDTYSINANTNTLTFGEAPPSGAIVEIIVGSISPVTAVVPDLSISTAKIADGAITTAKIANGAVITADLADGAVTSAKIADGAVTPAKLSTGWPNWDGAGNLSATSFVGPLTGAVTGNASTATRLATARTIALSGDVTGTASFDGSANATIAGTITNNSITSAKLGTNEQRQICKAWVNFSGITPVGIRSSYNVSSITKSGTGDYSFFFSTPMGDTNFTVLVSSGSAASWSIVPHIFSVSSFTTSSCRVSLNASNSSGAGMDSDVICIAIFGN